MDRTTELDLVRRVLAHLDAGTTDRDASPTEIPTSAYADETRHAREVTRLFHELPVAIGHASTIPKPGDYLTHDATGVPLLVVRGDDGRPAAFLNVCRHRGTRVEGAPCGSKKSFVCPYHAWTYGRDGRLLGVPHERSFGALDHDTRGLVRVPAAEAAGLLFVVPSPARTRGPARARAPAPDPDLATWLGPLASELEGFGTKTGHVYAPRSFTRELSWKLAIDVFLETYHLRPTHARSIYPMFFDNVGLVDRVGPHLRNVFPKRTIRDLRGAPDGEVVLRRHANVLYHLFPATLALVEPDHVAIVHIFPEGPARTRFITYMIVPEAPETDKARAYWDANDAILASAIDEDFAMGESIQRGLRSGANDTVVFGAFEHALAHFHHTIDERLGRPSP